MLSIEEGYRALREAGDERAGVGGATASRDVIRVTGGDAATYLQGQLTQDVDELGIGEAAWSLLLEPTGKLGSWIRVVHPTANEWQIDVDRGGGEAVVARLNRFKLRSDVTIELEDGPSPATPSEIPPEAVEVVRIEAGVPKMGAEITDDVIPAELGQWLIDASVSFTKGCYTGQELVARIDSRGGNVPRRLRGLVVEGAEVPPPGAEVVVDGEVVGTLTSSGYSPGLAAPVALAFVRRKVEPPAAAVIRTEAGEWSAEIRAVPLVG